MTQPSPQSFSQGCAGFSPNLQHKNKTLHQHVLITFCDFMPRQISTRWLTVKFRWLKFDRWQSRCTASTSCLAVSVMSTCIVGLCVKILKVYGWYHSDEEGRIQVFLNCSSNCIPNIYQTHVPIWAHWYPPPPLFSYTADPRGTETSKKPWCCVKSPAKTTLYELHGAPDENSF